VVENKDSFGIEAMNLSLSVAGCSAGDSAVSEAVNAASEAGVLPVVSAGNSGPAPCSIGDPAAAEEALTVANMYDTAEGGFKLRASSSRGPTADGRIKPDITAPGSEITSAASNTTDGYAAHSGTSMASPFVAGLALLMLDATPGLAPDELKQAIMNTAVDWGVGSGGSPADVPGVGLYTDQGYAVIDFGSRAEGPPGSRGLDIDYGAGRLDAYAALKRAGAPLDTAPTSAAHDVVEGQLAAKGEADVFQVDVPSGQLPFALTMIVTEGQVSEREQTRFSSSSDIYLPDPPSLTVRDPAGAVVPTDPRTGRQVSLSDTSVTPGTYTVEVRAPSNGLPEQMGRPLRYFIDVSHSAETDVDPPDTQITAGPQSTITSTAASFEFSSPGAAASFECSLDAAPYSPCSSPKTYTGLAEGEHAFSVAAKDAAGNTDPTPATRTFTVDSEAPPRPPRGNDDSQPSTQHPSPVGESRASDPPAALDTRSPETTITRAPRGRTFDRTPVIRFSADELEVAFWCSVDRRMIPLCSSPLKLPRLSDGKHVFLVWARDPSGNLDSSPSKAKFRVGPGSDRRR
jgi:hypothetical protein